MCTFVLWHLFHILYLLIDFMSGNQVFFSVWEINFFPPKGISSLRIDFVFKTIHTFYEGIFSNYKSYSMLSIYVKYLNWIN